MAELLNGIPRVDATATPPLMLRIITRILSTDAGSAVHRRVMAPLDLPLMRATGGRLHFGKGTIPIVVLRSTGAKSGIARDVPLGYFTEGDDVILIASNWGQNRHPNWYYNLLKSPQCQLFPEGRTDGGGHFYARLTQGEDHDRLLALAAGYAPNFGAYAVKTDGIRTINVFRLSPA
ncbi:nitroreductase/quinone reductase family protein [Mycobacterium sp. 2YAF39]|uniref:nitroreductase/quinone reductase family protein n=1 Tax=Mycobacterium sp. 2YAF39 TaxID=3233033 RepID=UPI003F9B26F8